ncbi:DUF4345 domain-containing protein [Terrihabitans rhizophilus]|uniref:DUF4345 domain-containing protein n=1 Tax=Terrihabitans rhizophilus TaxID=3092662 RepID=A0ABU4RS32_9HYPH|nr:DUF4345 domain-containing protein [Terrihabitans sp. PJ23]MDX6806889.1 DUF4345 domain-containing protein [Terrihabitans sp. PJ23]
MTAASERRLLQIAVALGGIVPVGAGLLGVIAGASMVPDGVPAGISLDSHVRYLSGLLLAMGLLFWASIPHVEAHTGRFRLLTLIVFVGGVARLFGLMKGLPSVPMLFGLVMELVVTPLICLWQARIARINNPDPPHHQG